MSAPLTVFLLDMETRWISGSSAQVLGKPFLLWELWSAASALAVLVTLPRAARVLSAACTEVADPNRSGVRPVLGLEFAQVGIRTEVELRQYCTMLSQPGVAPSHTPSPA